MNRHQVSRAGHLVRVGLFDHPGGQPHVDPMEETAEGWSVNLVCTGSFRIDNRHTPYVVGPHSVFVTHPGMVYRCRHDEDYPTDVCLTVDVAPELALEALGREQSRLPPVRPLSNRLGYLRFKLEKNLRADVSDLLLDEIALELLRSVAGVADLERNVYDTHSLTWYARRVDRVRDVLESDYSSPHPLADLARLSGISPFHLARVFREMVGVPPHRFLVQTRLAAAARFLREGRPVSETALACGFANLSHFVRAFSRHYGVSPGRYSRLRGP